MLAVFPLNIVVLPDEEVALHLFEPRYKELFADCRNGQEFVILFSDKNEKSEIGTTVYIEKIIEEFPDGTVDLIVKGKCIVKIQEFHQLFPSKLYSGVDCIELAGNTNCSKKLRESFEDYLEFIGKKNNKSDYYSLFHIANRLELNSDSKGELLSLYDYDKIDFYLINEIKFLKNIRKQEAKLNHKFHLN